MLNPGAALPRIALADDTGNTVNTGDFAGRPLVLWFYPKDDTPG
ncbi:MAG: redoxin domain-containing protein [Candidatus Baltobacteraceae bacterium]